MKNHRFSALSMRSFGRVAACILGGLCLVTAGPASADLERAVDDAKRIHVSGSRHEGLRVSFEPLKARYRVDEPIRFRVWGSRPFYLYLYSVDEASGEAVLLLPNGTERDNHYAGRRAYTVPGRSVEFLADRPGVERLVMVASTRYIDLDTSRFKAEHDLYRARAREIEEAFESKGLRIREHRRPGGTRLAELVVQEHEIAIRGRRTDLRDLAERYDWVSEREAAGEAVDQPVVFVSTDSPRYVEGERVRVVYGADQAGWVHLYAIEPGGSYSLLKASRVSGGDVKRLTARAEAPAGEHMLVAMFTEDGQPDEDLLLDLTYRRAGKGLRLEEDGKAMAVRRFRIYR